MTRQLSFKEAILQGIPDELPPARPFDATANHAPRRKDILSTEEKKLAIRNALRYFPARHHEVLAPEFYDELVKFGRIYMYRYRPEYEIYARPIEEYPHQSLQAAAIMLMIQNNLDPAVAQHPHELITYGGNGAVFQNWAQYLLTMKYLAQLTEEQTLHMYSGHPMGIFPSSKEAPRCVVTNGMMIPNYSSQDDWERYNALGVTQYGQMTAGSYMYIGPQGIVHGTTITILNAGRMLSKAGEGLAGKLFVTSGLGGMSGAQPKAGNIAGCITVVAEVNSKATQKRHQQGWVDEAIDDLDKLVVRVREAKEKKQVVSIAYQGNIVDVWEKFDAEDIYIDLGSDQTSLHNPWAGGYYPAGLSFEASNELMATNPEIFKQRVKESLQRHAHAINKHTARGTYFFDYGNAFLLEASRAGAAIWADDGLNFRYPSYVQDIMGPLCFDYGFGPFRWVCTSGTDDDLEYTDKIARRVLEDLLVNAPADIHPQLQDNIQWIAQAKTNKLVVGSKARILYADTEGRIAIAQAFNEAIRAGKIGPVVLGRDHHDVSGTDSPYRETSNIYDGSRFTADMAIHNVIGDSFRGATWVSIHNGGGVGWGEVINGGFGMLLDGSDDADRKLKNMLYFDVTNGIARRAWARNDHAVATVTRALKNQPDLSVTLPNEVSGTLLDNLIP
ncbi:urocanate hydratase [Ohtaekwangia koreensis]|uniref:Urocanate hydratase n=1 Tax=Ohtaekwangia koreensis TaxID=688867 RepID=A0A1T5KT63_9BACT|nr:urocanate hydratase [Ohtaekwangia koreensis]SKC66833.1 urocanate hydratase [Ohtaekwangia koreensis]